MTKRLSVDRFEGSVAVLVDDDGNQFDVKKSRLPEGAKECTVLSLDGDVKSGTFTIDHAETKRAAAEADAVRSELESRDPGGDVQI